MNRCVVVSLYTDGGPRADEFRELGKKLTASSTLPQYLIRDPFDGKVFDIIDYIEAKQSSFGPQIARSVRRFARGVDRHLTTQEAKR